MVAELRDGWLISERLLAEFRKMGGKVRGEEKLSSGRWVVTGYMVKLGRWVVKFLVTKFREMSGG